ncbi:MAG: FeoB small GTPase domain-containing protein [Phycisphaerales bacterium]
MGTESDKVAAVESRAVRVEPAAVNERSGGADGAGESAGARVWRLALVGNPNTGKTTLFNTLTGLRHRTSNFPGTTQEARLGRALGPHGGTGERAVQLIDLPGVYALSLAVSESRVCRAALLGEAAPAGERAAAPDGVLLVVDATNLSRNLTLAGEVLAFGLPTVVAAHDGRSGGQGGRRGERGHARRGAGRSAGCPVVACDPRDIRSAVAGCWASDRRRRHVRFRPSRRRWSDGRRRSQPARGRARLPNPTHQRTPEPRHSAKPSQSLVIRARLGLSRPTPMPSPSTSVTPPPPIGSTTSSCTRWPGRWRSRR